MKTVLLTLTVCLTSFGYGGRMVDAAPRVSGADSLVVLAETGWITVRSNPQGAEVFDDSTFLGVTPIVRAATRGGQHVLRLFYPSVRLWTARVSIDTIVVIPSEEKTWLVDIEVQSSQGMFKNVAESQRLGQSIFPTTSEPHELQANAGYIAGGAMILSGALAAYLKTTSDNKFNSYMLSRDPNLLKEVRRLDTWAGVTLFISEISFGVLTYLLLSD